MGNQAPKTPTQKAVITAACAGRARACRSHETAKQLQELTKRLQKTQRKLARTQEALKHANWYRRMHREDGEELDECLDALEFEPEFLPPDDDLWDDPAWDG